MTLFFTKKNMSDELIILAWDTFFVSRGRGISFDCHFPWARSGSNIWSVEAIDGGKVIGGLVVREETIPSRQSYGIVGCIGLVCVHPDYRGQGIANKLFEMVIQSSLSRKYSALTLWTNQHHIYQSKGFTVYDQSVYGIVTFNNNNNNNGYELKKLTKSKGLPPFAISGNEYSTNEAEISVVCDESGGIVVDWYGNDVSVISLIKSIFSDSFRINSRTGCSILETLRRDTCDINISKSNLQMWLQLNETVNIHELEASGRFSVLNRI
jgi:GNAT superfamily N-acetyltransferase